MALTDEQAERLAELQGLERDLTPEEQAELDSLLLTQAEDSPPTPSGQVEVVEKTEEDVAV